MSLDDHHLLVQRLMSLKGMVVLSGYQHECYSPLEKDGWIRHDIETTCYVSGKKSGKRSRRVESLWSNPACQQVIEELGTFLKPKTQDDLFSAIESAESICHTAKGAYITHQIRTDATSEKLQMAIRTITSSGRQVTIKGAAEIAGISREQASRRYRDLFA